MINNFITWTEFKEEIVTYNYETDDYDACDIPPTKINSFYLPKVYEIKLKERGDITDKEYMQHLMTALKEYSQQLIQDRTQIMTFKKLKLNFDYFDNTFKSNGEIYYRSHQRNVKTFLKRLLKDENNEYKYKDFDDVFYDEYKWFKLCYNGGLTHLKEKGDYFNTFGYDFKMSYPTDMADISFQIPTKQGTEQTLKELPADFKYIKFGIYRVIIESDDVNFKKVFMFSKHNGYTSYSLKYALKMAKTCNISITLIQDGQPNAYIYKREDLISGNKLFGNWYFRLLDMKNEMPKNSIVKLLSSSAWGHINELKTIKMNETELTQFIEEGNGVGSDGTDEEYIIVDMKPKRNTTIYELVKRGKPVYDMPIRLLPFITSFSRTKMSNLITKHNLFDKLIRIQTDSITMTEQFSEVVKGFNPDAKISGDLHFSSINNYHPL